MARSKAAVGWYLSGAALFAGAILLVYWGSSMDARADGVGEMLLVFLMALLLIFGFLGLVLLGLGSLGVGALVDWYKGKTD